MAKIFGLDIPSGLETLYQKVIALKPNMEVVGASLSLPKTTYRKNLRLRGYSLFVLWRSLWDGFDSTRRDAWATYWATLPFGPHSGSNGWPGSGYSAFVYVNAPRYRLGEDLLLDPPISLNLITNGMVVGDPPDSWSASEAGELLGDGYITSPAGDYDHVGTGVADNTTPMNVVYGTSYRCTFDIIFSTEFPELYDLGKIAVHVTAEDGESPDVVFVGETLGNPSNNGTISYDFDFSGMPGVTLADFSFLAKDQLCGCQITNVQVFAI